MSIKSYNLQSSPDNINFHMKRAIYLLRIAALMTIWQLLTNKQVAAVVGVLCNGQKICL